MPGMSDLDLVKGAAILLAQKLCLDVNATKSSITIGGLQRKGSDDKPKNYRVIVVEISDEEVEHERKVD